MNTQILNFNMLNVQKCAEEIMSGGIVAFPTETVYGLGANVLDENAVKKIFQVKGRPSDNPLICHVSDKSQIEMLGVITPMAEKIIEAFMPGPVTIVLPKRNVSDFVTGGLKTVGIRMPLHECAQALISACGVPLCAPSANTSTRPSPTVAAHVYEDLNGKIRYVLDGGRCDVGLESTIVDCINGRILRQGGLEQEKLESVVGKLLSPPKDTSIALSPGMKYRHYSPLANVYLANYEVGMREKIMEKYDLLDGKRIILTLNGDYLGRETYIIGKTESEYAHNVFWVFRELDKQGYNHILCEGVDNKGIGAALMNRLLKASGGKIV